MIGFIVVAGLFLVFPRFMSFTSGILMGFVWSALIWSACATVFHNLITFDWFVGFTVTGMVIGVVKHCNG